MVLFYMITLGAILAAPPPLPPSWAPTTIQSNLLHRANDLNETMTTEDVELFFSTNVPPDGVLVDGVWPMPLMTNPTTYVTNGVRLVPSNYKEAKGYFTKSIDDTPLPVPDEVTALFGYQEGAPYCTHLVGNDPVVTNYTLLKTFAGAITRPDKPPPPPKVMSFTMVLYDDLTRAPMGEIEAEVNWKTGFMSTELKPISLNTNTP
jgi:hypothetical protein